MNSHPALPAILLTGMDSLGKILMREFAPLQVTWARFFFHTIIVSLLFYWQGYRHFAVTKAPKTQLLRGLCMVGVNATLYIAIQTVSLAEATAIMYLSPVVVTLLAGVLLGEKLMPRHLLAVSTGFAGVLVIIRPVAECAFQDVLGWHFFMGTGLIVGAGLLLWLTSQRGTSDTC